MSAARADVPPGRRTASLLELARLFLRLGVTAFGGPAVHIAMMEDEVVRRRPWLTREQFLDFLGATNLIPGPNSTEMAIHIGFVRAGWPGLLVAGLSFIVPAALIVGAIAWVYVRFGTLVQAEALLYGVKPVAVAIVAQALVRLARTAVRSWTLALVAAACVVAAAAGVHELILLPAAGGVMAASALVRRPGGMARHGLAVCAAGAATTTLAAQAAVPATPVGLWPIFLVFAKAGALLYGSGYVLFAFLRADLVERYRWLTEAELIDAIAIGQVTPGPLFTTATFVGYVLGGTPGAAIATAGIFLPAFVFVALMGPIVPRLRRSAAAGAALDGVNAAALALMTVVSWQLGRTALVDPLTVALAAISLFALVRFRVNSAWLIAAGGLAGLATWALA
ncbi:MAG TPA: chromate efflux transporter [Vicinamibacterales bacterium]